MGQEDPGGSLAARGSSVRSPWVQPLGIRAGCHAAGAEQGQKGFSVLLSLRGATQGPPGAPGR